MPSAKKAGEIKQLAATLKECRLWPGRQDLYEPLTAQAENTRRHLWPPGSKERSLDVSWAERKALRWEIRWTRMQVFGDECVLQEVEAHLWRAGRQPMHRRGPRRGASPNWASESRVKTKAVSLLCTSILGWAFSTYNHLSPSLRNLPVLASITWNHLSSTRKWQLKVVWQAGWGTTDPSLERLAPLWGRGDRCAQRINGREAVSKGKSQEALRLWAGRGAAGRPNTANHSFVLKEAATLTPPRKRQEVAL